MIDELFKLSQSFIRNYNRDFQRYFLKKYPYFMQFEDKTLFHLTLDQNIHAAVECDLPAVMPGLNGSGLKKLKSLISFIAESVPFIPDMRNLKRLMGRALVKSVVLRTHIWHWTTLNWVLETRFHYGCLAFCFKSLFTSNPSSSIMILLFSRFVPITASNSPNEV